jgi:tetratricopeptide (TPR) repeat protein
MFLDVNRLDTSKCHDEISAAISLYEKNQPVEAMESAWAAVRSFKDDATATDWIVLGNLAQNCGLTSRCRAAYRIGHQRFPNDGQLAALYAWELSASSQSQRCMQVLQKGMKSAPECLPLLQAVACYNHSLNRWMKTARKFHKSAIAQAENDAFVIYILSRAAARRTEWKQSIELNRKALEIEPDWTRAKIALHDSYLCSGETRKAGEILQSATKNRRHIWCDFSVSTYLEVIGKHDKAIRHLEKIVHYYPPNSKIMKFSVRQLVLLLMKEDKIDRAREVTSQFSIKGFEEWEDYLTEDQRKVYISVPMVAQTTNHCVPTVAAMVAKAQGYAATAANMATKMETRHGTPMWRLIDCMKELGFRATCIKPEIPFIEKMLEQNVPLIGELSGVFNGHVDVVCGFNSGLKLFHLRDPMHWYGYSLPYEAIEKKYENTCSLWAMVAPDNVGKVAIEDDWINREAEALIDLGRAVATGKRQDAELAFKQIPDDHPLSFDRDGMSRQVVLTDAQCDQRMEKEVDSISEDSDLSLTQIRSMLAAIDETNSDRIVQLAKKNEERLGKGWVNYVECTALLATMDFKKAESKLAKMVKRYPGMESAWSQLGGVKAELGKPKEAEHCHAIALEIAPENEIFQAKTLDRLQHKLPYHEILKKAKSIIRKNAWSPRVQYPMSTLLARSGDGLEYEKSLQDCIRYFPRNAYNYNQLAGWYMLQNRVDLARSVMQEGRALVGEDELPIADYEKSAEERKAAESEQQSKSKPSESKQSASTTLNEADSNAKSNSLFQRHYSLLLEKAQTEPWSSFQKTPELTELKSANEKHQLTWVQCAELLTWEIGNLLGDLDGEFKTDAKFKAEKLDSILPAKVPGIGELFVGYVFDRISFAETPTPILDVALKWFEKIAPESHKYPDVQFEKSLLIEYQSKLNEAEEMLNQIIREHPCFVIAWYRLGQLYSQRNEQSRAFEMFEKCIELQPGYFGAISELMRLAPNVAPEKAEFYADAMVNYLPYSQGFAYDAAMQKVAEDDFSRGIQFIDSRREFLGDSKHAATKARFLADLGEHSAAVNVLSNAKISPDDEFAANWVRVDCSVAEEKFDEAEKWLEKLEAEQPDDESVVDQKVRLLRIRSIEEAKAYAIERIESGKPLPILAHVAVSEENNPLKFIKDMLEKVPEKHRELTAMAFHEAILQLDDARLTIGFLKHCRKTMPHVASFAESLVYMLGMAGNASESEKVAQELHQSDPNNPQWMSLLGWAIQDRDPKESIKLLNREYEITNSVETLARLARGHQLNNDLARAEDTWHTVLVRNPNHVLALTNLSYKFGITDSGIAAKFNDTIEKQLVHPSDQYFLTQAVKIAKQNKLILPVSWISLALQRAEQMEMEAPFLDESKLLRQAIFAWLNNWGIKDLPFKVGFVSRIKSKMLWPKTDWIPNPPS